MHFSRCDLLDRAHELRIHVSLFEEDVPVWHKYLCIVILMIAACVWMWDHEHRETEHSKLKQAPTSSCDHCIHFRYLFEIHILILEKTQNMHVFYRFKLRVASIFCAEYDIKIKYSQTICILHKCIKDTLRALTSTTYEYFFSFLVGRFFPRHLCVHENTFWNEWCNRTDLCRSEKSRRFGKIEKYMRRKTSTELICQSSDTIRLMQCDRYSQDPSSDTDR